LIKKEFRRKVKIEYISENFDQAAYQSLLNDPEHEEIKENLNLDDDQIDSILTIFDKTCSKYGFANKHILAHYLLIVSIRTQTQHDMMDRYVQTGPDDQRSFGKYCEKNNLLGHYKQKDHILLEGLFTLYPNSIILEAGSSDFRQEPAGKSPVPARNPRKATGFGSRNMGSVSGVKLCLPSILSLFFVISFLSSLYNCVCVYHVIVSQIRQ
jgi:hypothetical protein